MAGSGTVHLREKALLRVEDLVVEHPLGHRRYVQAVSKLSFDVAEGETLGLVGESGCGKSSTGRAVMQLPRPVAGKVDFEGRDIASLPRPELRRVRRRLQMVFQDPISSLNPRRRVGDIVAEPLVIAGNGTSTERRERVREAMTAVGLDPELVWGRRRHEFSGGQCQRICIARALVMRPRLLICDEPVSSLDVSVQAQILNLLEDMKARFGLTMVFISHDLAVVKNVSDRIAVMYLGKLCEVAPSEQLHRTPAHPYTASLLDSIPVPDPHVPPRPAPVRGEPPSPLAPPPGCRFHTRCPRAQERCRVEEPVVRPIAPGHFAACHFPLTSGAVN
ncbi:MAG TPA: ABC transporter ATP-binding protein [Candidatus Dormibacteraeota bacterium]|nr:ABC transporter ATP-binding protein [Candidatus Dormibacteraeota bacterium]